MLQSAAQANTETVTVWRLTCVDRTAACNTGSPGTCRHCSRGLVQSQAPRIDRPNIPFNAVQQFAVSIVKEEDCSAEGLGHSSLLPCQGVCQGQMAAHCQLERGFCLYAKKEWPTLLS